MTTKLMEKFYLARVSNSVEAFEKKLVKMATSLHLIQLVQNIFFCSKFILCFPMCVCPHILARNSDIKLPNQ